MHFASRCGPWALNSESPLDAPEVVQTMRSIVGGAWVLVTNAELALVTHTS